MCLSDLWWAWALNVVGPLRSVEETLRNMSGEDVEETHEHAAGNDLIAIALDHVHEARALLTIGTEEMHTLEAAGVGRYRLQEDAA